MMTPKREQFVLEYPKDFNATQAAIRSGFSVKTAYSQGQRLLKDVEVQRFLSESMKKRALRAEITAERVLHELSILAFADMADYVEIGQEGQVTIKPFDDAAMPEGASRAVSGVKEVRRIIGSGTGEDKDMVLEIRTEYKHHDKVKALELLGNHLGMWKDRTALEFPDVETFELPKLATPSGKGNGNGGNGNGGHGH